MRRLWSLLFAAFCVGLCLPGCSNTVSQEDAVEEVKAADAREAEAGDEDAIDAAEERN